MDFVALTTLDPSRYGLTGNTSIIELARNLCSMRHDIRIFSLAIGERPRKPIMIEGVEINPVLPFYIAQMGYRGPIANVELIRPFRKYLRLLARSDAEVIHVIDNPIPISVHPFISTKKFLYHVNAPFVRTFDEAFLYRTSSFPVRKSVIFERLFERLAYHLSDTVTVLTHAMKEALKRWGLAAPETTVVIPSGVNEKLFVPGKDKMASPTILYTGSITPFRGIETMIEAFRLVKQTIKDAKLLIVGGTYEKYLEELNSRIVALNLKNEVKITGYVPYRKVAQIAGRSHVGVSPIPPLEQYKVSFPLKTLEYMASGLPVVATDQIAGHLEALDDECAALVPYNPPAIARGIIRFLSNRREAYHAGMAGRRKVQGKFTWKAAAERYSQLYSRL